MASRLISERHPWVKYLALISMGVAIYAGAIWISFSLIVALAWGAVIAIAVRPIQRKLGQFIGAKMAAISLIGLTCVLFTIMAGIAGYGAVTEIGSLSEKAHHLIAPHPTSAPANGPDAATQDNPAASQNDGSSGKPEASDHSGEEAGSGSGDSETPALPPAVSARIDKVKGVLPASLANKIDPRQIMKMAKAQAKSISKIAGLAAFKILKSIPHLLEAFFIAMLTAACCLLSYGRITSSLRRVSMELTQRDDILLHIVRSVRGAVNGLVLVGIGEALVCSPLIFVADASHAVILTILLAIAASIPFCGYPAAILIGGIVAASGSMNMGIAVAGWGLFVLFCGEHFARPKFISDETRLPFLHTMVAILGGLHMLGLVGLFIGPAIVAAAHMLWCELDGSRRAPKNSKQAA
ncbi:AI-2E family transporter [Asaia bogorensis]|uniref:AI-2E family transporter n=1 Tax=Asaia bogorensis TaxID=91915 RepID=UPI0028551208|nr:AI-2E family transporter [Asaia bogorensis]MDR6183533.1 putative PurR-regulated permease PerM [Asaia bogorensis NBRC 16594]